MKRSILAVGAGLVVWVLVVSLLNHGLRALIPGYAQAEPTMAFTLGMMVARLGIAAVTSIVAGAAAAALTSARSKSTWVIGGILVALFVPLHVHLWHVFPVWYHLTFLLTLAPLVAAGGKLLGRRPADKPASSAQPA